MTEKNDTKQLIDRLEATRNLSRDEWIRLIQNRTADDADYLFERAQAVRTRQYGRSVYIRGLIEFTNYCKNDCFYCGIRKSNRNANRYRLTKEQIDCIQKYYQKYAFPSCKSTPIILASLGNDAGIYGAARMVIKD